MGAVLLLALVTYLVSRLLQPVAPAYVTIYVGDAVYASVPANVEQTVTVDQGDGKVNVVVIDAQGIFMASSTCPNQLCVQQGAIHPAQRDALPLNNRIICLPNGVTVALTDAQQ